MAVSAQIQEELVAASRALVDADSDRDRNAFPESSIGEMQMIALDTEPSLTQAKPAAICHVKVAPIKTSKIHQLLFLSSVLEEEEERGVAHILKSIQTMILSNFLKVLGLNLVPAKMLLHQLMKLFMNYLFLLTSLINYLRPFLYWQSSVLRFVYLQKTWKRKGELYWKSIEEAEMLMDGCRMPTGF